MYQVWQTYELAGDVASVRRLRGISAAQIDAVRWGRPLEDFAGEVVIEDVEPGRLPDLMTSGWGARFVTEPVRDVLDRHCPPDTVQWIPARLAPLPEQRYWLLNALVTLPCFDWERSQYRSFPDAPRSIDVVESMVLHAVPNDAPPLFRIRELVFTQLIRDDVRAEVEAAAELPGVFVPVADYTRGVWPEPE